MRLLSLNFIFTCFNFDIKATKSIQTLLDKALDVIPKEYQSRAQVTLKATAGLRMISDEIANQILENVIHLVNQI